METTLTISGSIEEMTRVLSLLGIRNDSTASMAVEPGEVSILRGFVDSLDKKSARVVEHLQRNPGTEYSAQEFSQALGVNVAEFYGFVGVIGRSWKATFPSRPNPFASRRSRSKTGAVWSVTETLVAELGA